MNYVNVYINLIKDTSSDLISRMMRRGYLTR